MKLPGTRKKRAPVAHAIAALAALCLLAFGRPVYAAGQGSTIKLPLYIKVESAAYAYDGTEHALTNFAVTNAGEYSDIKVVWDFRLARTDAGSVSSTDAMASAIRVYSSGEDFTDYFNIHVTHGALTIKKLAITVHAEDAVREYNGASQSAQLGFQQPSGLVPGDYVSSAFAASGKNAGVYQADRKEALVYSPSRKQDVTKNYDVSVSGATLTILPNQTASVTIEPDAKSMLYGGKQPALTAKVTGALGADSSSFSYDLKRDPGTDAGSYAIRVSGQGDSVYPNRNYKNIRVKTGVFAILPSVSYEYASKEPKNAPKPPARSGVAAGQACSVQKSPELEGYEFSGWSTKDVKVSGGRFTVPAGKNEITFTGSFKALPFSIRYYVDGELVATEKYSAGENVSPLEEPAKEGATFSGWNAVPSVMPSSDVEVRGSFTGSVFRIDFYINNVLYETQNYIAGDPVSPPQASSIDGFGGWTDAPEFMPSQDLSLYAIHTEYTSNGSGQSGGAAGKTWSPINLGCAAMALILCIAYNFGLFSRKHPPKAALRALGALSSLSAAAVFAYSSIGASGMGLVDKWTPIEGIALAVQALIPLRLGKKVYVDEYYYEEEEGEEGGEPDGEDSASSLATSDFEVILPNDPKADKGEIPAL
jgi:hypothetical protein